MTNHLSLGQTKFRDSIDKHAAGPVQGLKNRDVIAHLSQISGTGQTGRACPDHSDLMPIGFGVILRHNPPGGGSIRGVALQLANCHRLTLDSPDTDTLALGLLGTDAAADSGQGRGQ